MKEESYRVKSNALLLSRLCTAANHHMKWMWLSHYGFQVCRTSSKSSKIKPYRGFPTLSVHLKWFGGSRRFKVFIREGVPNELNCAVLLKEEVRKSIWSESLCHIRENCCVVLTLRVNFPKCWCVSFYRCGGVSLFIKKTLSVHPLGLAASNHEQSHTHTHTQCHSDNMCDVTLKHKIKRRNRTEITPQYLRITICIVYIINFKFDQMVLILLLQCVSLVYFICL